MKKSHLVGAIIIGILLVAATIIILSVTGVFGSSEQTLLVFSTESREKIYDAEPLTASEWKLLEGQLKPGHTVAPSVYGTQTSAGVSENKMSVKILDANQADVTAEYRIEYRFGTLNVTKRKIKVVSNSASKQYDGTPINCEASRLEGGTLVNGHRLDVKYGSSRTEVGVSENIITVDILDSSNATVTSNYEIDITKGSLVISGYPLAIRTESDEKTYDGTPLKNSNWEITSGELKPNHYIEVDVIGTQTNAGESKNEIIVEIYETVNGKKEKVTGRYDIAMYLGTLTVKKRDITVKTGSLSVVYGDERIKDGILEYDNYVISGELAPNQFTEVDVTGSLNGLGKATNTCTITILHNGNQVTDNYNITKEEGELAILPVDIQITSHDAYISYEEFVSGGEVPLTNNSYSKSIAKLVGDHQLNVIIKGEQKGIGSSPNWFDVEITTPDGEDASMYYTISTVYGTLEVGTIHLTIGTSGGEKTYDGERLSVNSDDDWWIIEGALREGHKVSSAIFTKSLLDVGRVANEVKLTIIDEETNENVTSHYSFTYEFGYLEIKPYYLFVTTTDYSDMYNGELIHKEEYFITGGLEELIARGHTYSVSMPVYERDVGVYPNLIDFVIYDANGRVITQNYYIQKNEGTIEILKRTVAIRTGSAYKEKYDGIPLTNDSWEYISETRLVEGHELIITVVGSQTQNGSSPNYWGELRVEIGENLENAGQDVTKNYDFELSVMGTLTVGKTGGGGGGGGDGFGGGGLPGPGQPNSQVIGRVKSTSVGHIYLRMSSYGDYIGATVNYANEYNGLIDNTYGMNYLSSLALEGVPYNTQTMELEYFTENYYLPYYLGVEGGAYKIQTSDVEYLDEGCEKAIVPYYDMSCMDGSIPSVPSDYSMVESAYADYVYSNYLSLEGYDELKAYLNNIISENGFSKDDPYVISKVVSYIRTCASYNLKYDKELDKEEDVILSFMKIYKEGVCHHYSMAGMAMFRALGIPARYVGGVVVDIGEPDTWTEVNANKAHAWIEVYIDGTGWIALDVTGGSAQQKTKIEITPYVDPVKYYDGAVLEATDENVYYRGDKTFMRMLEDGYTIECTKTGSINSVGYGVFTISDIVIKDPDGDIVTEKYEMKVNEGRLHLYISELYIESLSQAFDFSGTEQSYKYCDYDKNALISPNHYVELSFGKGLRNAGSQQNYFTCVVYEGTGENRKDVSYMYNIKKSYGTITVNPIKLTITADSTRLTYSQLVNEYGGVYTAQTYTLSRELFDGHRFEYVTQSGSLSGKGQCTTAILTYKIINVETGQDETENYDIIPKKSSIFVGK